MSDVLLEVKNLTRTFDVSLPWLNRVIEQLTRRFAEPLGGSGTWFPAGGRIAPPARAE